MTREHSGYRVTILLATIFTHVLAVSITLLVVYWVVNFRGGFAFRTHVKSKIFNLHPLLMILGFIIFSGEEFKNCNILRVSFMVPLKNRKKRTVNTPTRTSSIFTRSMSEPEKNRYKTIKTHTRT
ncbi:hypothetical protein R6Q57_014788 [Mikania cordata]